MNKVITYSLAAVALVACGAAGAAVAQTAAPAIDTVVQVPIGQWADAILPTAGSLFMAAVAWGFRQLPERISTMLKTFQVEQMLEKAKDFGINTVKGATKDKVLEVNVGNAVVAQGTRFVIENGPAWLVKWLGGPEGIARRIIARLDLDENAGTDPAVVLQGAIPRV